MSLSSISVGNVRGYDFGVGVDRLSGSPMNQVVRPTYSPVEGAPGGIYKFDVSRVTTSKDLQQKLGIDVQASYGCGLFASAEARFSFLQESSVHSSTLFMMISAAVQLGDLSIDNCVLTEEAGKSVGNFDTFTGRYGDMFCRACTRGGIFVAVLRVETFDNNEANNIEASLAGSYGLFDAEISAAFKKVVTERRVSVYYSLHREGGPDLQVHDPRDPEEMLANANKWMTAMINEGDRYSRPYQWTLAPIKIANGPAWPNAADIEHAQDVLKFCARERTDLLDDINQLQWFLDKQDAYDWSATPTTTRQVADAVRDFQFDLETVADCASEAMNDARAARMPAVFAAEEDRSPYRQTLVPSPLPPRDTTALIPVVSLVGLRGSTLKHILEQPTRSYDEYERWAVENHEPGTVAIVPPRAWYDFLTSGIAVKTTTNFTAGVSGFWTWVFQQTPTAGTVRPGDTINLVTKIAGSGWPPPELRHIWGL